jgi:predicted RNA-binding protein with PIN domain
MRTLIDGYNLMYAAGLMERQFGPDGLRKVRHRFLNDLASRLGSADARVTTVVFDANHHPAHLSPSESHKGLTVLYAVAYDDADSQIEDLIKHHALPRSLSVVSSDHRVRDAARRRGALPLTSEAFLDQLDRPRLKTMPLKRRPDPDEVIKKEAERARWLHEFGHLDEGPELNELARRSEFLPNDDELDRIAREVDAEGPSFGRKTLLHKKIG